MKKELCVVNILLNSSCSPFCFCNKTKPRHMLCLHYSTHYLFRSFCENGKILPSSEVCRVQADHKGNISTIPQSFATTTHPRVGE